MCRLSCRTSVKQMITATAALSVAAMVLFGMTSRTQASCPIGALHGAGVLKNQTGPCSALSTAARVGDTVTVVIQVVNIDQCLDTLIVNSITDTVHHLGGDVTTANLLPGGNPVTLAPNASTTVTYTYTVQPGDDTLPNKLLTDTANVNITDTRDAAGGTAQTFNQQGVSQINIISPALTVTKTCELTGTPENPIITVSGDVTNSGDTDLQQVEVVDPTTGLDEFLGPLAVGQTVAYTTTTYTATSNPSVNTVTATGWVIFDEVNGNCFEVNNTATCSVDIPCNPQITVDKTCSVTGTFGSFVLHISGTVSNPGDVTLTGVTVTDSPSGQVISLPDIAPGGSEPYSADISLPADTACATDVTDTVTASANFASICPQTQPITATASATCTTPACLCNPAIAVTKTCTVSGTAGAFVVSYSGTVSNTGDIPLTGVTVQDNQGGAAITIGDLAVGGSAPYSGTYTLPAATACNTAVTDTVTASGTGVGDCTPSGGTFAVSATASATCTTPACQFFGCTPGFFKNCTKSWPAGVSTTTPLNSIFTIPTAQQCPSLASCQTKLNSATLLQALSFQGGNTVCGAAETLLRAATAAYLNSLLYGGAYPVSTADLITQVNAALLSCDRATIISLATQLDQFNNAGCKDPANTSQDLKCLR